MGMEWRVLEMNGYLFSKLMLLIPKSQCFHLAPGAVLDQGPVPFPLEIPLEAG